MALLHGLTSLGICDYLDPYTEHRGQLTSSSDWTPVMVSRALFPEMEPEATGDPRGAAAWAVDKHLGSLAWGLLVPVGWESRLNQS